ncbi:MAG: immunoglobulin-like domain-containing protein [Flavobacterium sp.]
MNKFYMFWSILFLSVTGMGCNNRESTSEQDISLVDEESEVSVEEEMFYHRLPDVAFVEMDDVIKNVSIQVDKETYDSAPSTLEVLILNNSDVDITTESVYEISKFESDDWIKLDMGNVNLVQRSHSISAGFRERISIDLFSEQVVYSKGLYRIQLFFSFEWGTFEQEVEVTILE